MKSIFRTISHGHQTGRRSFTDTSEYTVRFVRDRGLDHAVHKEKNLRPLLNIKDLITSSPSKSTPSQVITKQRHSLDIRYRPIDFIRRFPSVFHESLPGGNSKSPNISLTPEVLEIDAEEKFVYGSESYKQGLADRLFKLLMICQIDRIPLEILDFLKWDLGLPHDYVDTVIPEFPDYFRIIKSKVEGCRGELELVCWSNEHSVSVLEKEDKGSRISFPMNFSAGFVVDKEMQSYIDEWQKLPYVSPYKNARRLSLNADEADKWAAAVLHEILNLFVSKKVEKDTVMLLGEVLGLRSRFKRVIHFLPGVFYVSGELWTHTVVLRDAFKRGVLIESNELMDIRYRYVQLMKVNKKEKEVSSGKRDDKDKVQGEVVDSDAQAEYDDISGSEDEEDANQNLKRSHKNSPRAGQRSLEKSASQGKLHSSQRGDRRTFEKSASPETPHSSPRAGRRNLERSGSQEKPHSSQRAGGRSFEKSRTLENSNSSPRAGGRIRTLEGRAGGRTRTLEGRSFEKSGSLEKPRSEHIKISLRTEKKI